MKKKKKNVKKKVVAVNKPKEPANKPKKQVKEVKKVEPAKKKIKIKSVNVVLALLILYIIGYFIYLFITMPITSIYVEGNTYYKDQEIIRIADIEKYPYTFVYTNKKIESNLLEDTFIKDCDVKKKFFTRVYIKVEENNPLFYYEQENKTYLRNKTKLDGNDYNVPILNNEIDKKYLDDFIKGINKVDLDILNRISEIKYDPDSVDERRLLLTMNDGNYVYVTMKKFDVLNNYVDFIREFDNKKGILYLNSGEYFKIFE